MLLICGLAENAPLWSQRHEYIGQAGQGQGAEIYDNQARAPRYGHFHLRPAEEGGAGNLWEQLQWKWQEENYWRKCQWQQWASCEGWCVATVRECCKAEEGVGGNL